ncbi:cardiolipin synthase [Limosilactobacillus sp.]|uniref:cardiolipin synthase n=1 Tax=Limosilactobacillus sp. TaxID=2773925 RepID=UPI00345E599B
MNIVWTWDIIRRIIEVLWLTNIAFAIWTVFRTRRDIASTWAWLLVLSVFPVIGFILYLFVGRKISSDDIFNMQDEERRFRQTYVRKQADLLKKHRLLLKQEHLMSAHQMVTLSTSLNDALVSFDNQVRIFTDGEKLFSQMIKDFDQAQDHIDVEFYTFYADNLGHRILSALERAAARGVQVKVLYDLSGSRGTTYKFFAKLESLGGHAQPFNSRTKQHFNTPRLNYHLHRKIVTIDDKVGYIGGFNIGDQYVGKMPKFGYWRDTHIRVVGQAVLSLTGRFGMDWNATCQKTGKPKVDLDQLMGQLTTKRPTNDAANNVAMQIVSSGPDSENVAIRRGYEAMISAAHHYVYIQTPYLIPGEPMLEALVIAARSGVDVRIMVPCMPDHPFVYRATEYYAKYLANNGVKVYKYDNGFIHAKTVISDDYYASVGSANQDFRSYRLNWEANAFMYNEQLTKELKQIFEDDLKKSTQMTPAYFAKQSRWRQFKQYFSRLLSPVL